VGVLTWRAQEGELGGGMKGRCCQLAPGASKGCSHCTQFLHWALLRNSRAQEEGNEGTFILEVYQVSTRTL